MHYATRRATASAMIRGSTLAGLLALGVAGGSDPGDDLPPALAERHQRAVSGDTAAQLDLGLRYVTGKGLAPDERAALRCIGNAAERRRARRAGPGSWCSVRLERRRPGTSPAAGATIPSRTAITVSALARSSGLAAVLLPPLRQRRFVAP